MGDFFKSWRRKIGCVALMMAAVFMMGWVRSLSDTDVFVAPIGKSRIVVPYWMAVIPLTLLSAWLLLSKPNKSTQMKIIEPILEKRA